MYSLCPACRGKFLLFDYDIVSSKTYYHAPIDNELLTPPKNDCFHQKLIFHTFRVSRQWKFIMIPCSKKLETIINRKLLEIKFNHRGVKLYFWIRKTQEIHFWKWKKFPFSIDLSRIFFELTFLNENSVLPLPYTTIIFQAYTVKPWESFSKAISFRRNGNSYL